MSIFTRVAEDYSAEVLVPNRYSETLRMWFLRCPCGASAGLDETRGELGNHFLPHDPDRAYDPAAIIPGTALCRYSGRTVTLRGALERDAKLTRTERFARSLASP